jgi:pimeloyl-ACP methyl ester carboxylesterase
MGDTARVGHFSSAAARQQFLAAYHEAMGTLPPPDRVLDLQTTYGVVRFYRFDGTTARRVPIVLLPGRASASPVWADNLPSLLKEAPIYTVDLLGEPGMSIQHKPISNAADQAQWLHEALIQLPEPQLDLLGLSIGGWTAMNLVVHNPGKVRAVMLVDPVFVFARMSTAAIVRSIPASVRILPKSWRDSFNSWTANGAPVEDVPVARMIEAGMHSYALKLPGPRQLKPEELARLNLPVLVIVAGRSPMHNPQAVAAVARRTIRTGQVTVYPDASHAINGEYPDEIANDVRTFRSNLQADPG